MQAGDELALELSERSAEKKVVSLRSQLADLVALKGLQPCRRLFFKEPTEVSYDFV